MLLRQVPQQVAKGSELLLNYGGAIWFKCPKLEKSVKAKAGKKSKAAPSRKRNLPAEGEDDKDNPEKGENDPAEPEDDDEEEVPPPPENKIMDLSSSDNDDNAE